MMKIFIIYDEGFIEAFIQTYFTVNT